MVENKNKKLIITIVCVGFFLILLSGIPVVQASLISDTWENVLVFFGIIKITNANHLNSERNIISNIYNEVYQLDGIWSEEIFDGNYVRVTFETKLDSSRDITVYPRVVSGTPKVEVYEIDGTEIIAEFTNIISNEYNKVFLTNLIGTQDTFDLRIVGGSLEFDYIVDPTTSLTVIECDSEGTGSCTVSNIDTSDASYETLDKNEYFVINYTDLSCNTLSNITVFLDIWAQDEPAGETVTLTCSVDGTTYDKCGTNTWAPTGTKATYSYPATGVTCSNINNFRMKLVSNDGGGPDDFYLDYTYVFVNYTESVGGDCSPTLNEDWVISDTQTCDGVDVTTGTGDINVTTGGKLYLINSANVTTTKLNAQTTGDQLFVNSGCRFIIM